MPVVVNDDLRHPARQIVMGELDIDRSRVGVQAVPDQLRERTGDKIVLDRNRYMLDFSHADAESS